MKGRPLAKPADEPAGALLDADAAVADATENWDEGLAGRILSPIAELGDQPAMRILCGSVIGFRSGGFEDDVLIEAGACALYDGPRHLLADYERSPLGQAR